MTVQTTYSTTHNEAYAGMIADSQLKNTISKLNKSGAIIPYGKGVVSDGEDASLLPDSGSVAKEFNGVCVYEVNRAQADGAVAGAVIGQDFTVMTEGVIWVTARATVAKDDPVFLRVGATTPGDFSNVVGSGGTLAIAITGAKFLTGGATGELVKISLGLGG